MSTKKKVLQTEASPKGKMTDGQAFWQVKSLAQMSQQEWESLCDGCGRCCLNKIEYQDTKEIFYTKVACRLLDDKSCQCRDYDNRKREVPDCIQLSPRNIKKLTYMPDTCAYRLLAEGKPLKWWHPLISGDSSSVHKAGISVRAKTISEEGLEGDLEDYLISWIKPIRPKKAKTKASKKP